MVNSENDIRNTYNGHEFNKDYCISPNENYKYLFH
jgi:hypothetical protein